MNVPLPVLCSGMGRLAVRLVDGASAVTAAEATDPLKLLVTTPRGACAWAFTTTYGGGLLAGDRIDLQVRVGAGARLYLGTQANTKIYRSPDGRPATQRLRLAAGPGALVVGLPDPVTPFADAIHEQDQELDLDGEAGLMWLDGVTAGRAARDERWRFTSHRSRLRLRVDGRLRALDALALVSRGDGEGRTIAQRMGDFGAMATLLVGGGMLRDRALAIHERIASMPVAGGPAAPALLRTSAPIAGWGTFVRLAAPERETLDRLVRELLGDLRPLIDDDPWERRP